MIAYNKSWLNNLAIQEYAGEAVAGGLIGKAEADQIRSRYPIHFYSPAILLRIGLALLTILVSAAVFGILILLLQDQYTFVCLLLGAGSIAVLELAIRKWKHYRSGIDDILLHSGILYLCLAFDLETSFSSDILMAGVAVILYTLAFIRYLDRFSIVMGTAALIWLLYTVLDGYFSIPKAWVLISIATVMLLIFLSVYRLQKYPALSLYRQHLQLIKYTVALACYASLHRYIVGEYLGAPQSLFNWLVWIWTISIPPLILFFGIRNSNRPWIRIGLGLTILLLFYIQVQYAPMSQDLAAILYGILLVCIAWWAIKYLQSGSSRFTDEAGASGLRGGNLESLAITIGFSPLVENAAGPARTGTEFGGGNFGGGGAGAEF